jgi:nucleotide-binding universal stress UspA family protein
VRPASLRARTAATALLVSTVTATLLVIGGRTGALSGLVRGSVSRALMEAVPCPVLAVPRNVTSSDGPPATITPFLSGL